MILYWRLFLFSPLDLSSLPWFLFWFVEIYFFLSQSLPLFLPRPAPLLFLGPLQVNRHTVRLWFILYPAMLAITASKSNFEYTCFLFNIPLPFFILSCASCINWSTLMLVIIIEFVGMKRPVFLNLSIFLRISISTPTRGINNVVSSSFTSRC